MDVLRDSPLGIEDGALQIAIADRESDRHVTLQRFTVDERRALGGLDIGDLVQRDLAAGWQVDADLAHRVEALAILRLPSHDQVEAPVALKHLRDGLTADCRLHDRADVADVESVARASGAVGRDLQIRLAHRAQHYFIDDAGNPAQAFP